MKATEVPGVTALRLAVMEACRGVVGSGPVATCHVQAHRLRDLGGNDPRLIGNEEIDGFISRMGEGDRPSTFEVEGFEGEWVVTVYPYC